MIWGIHLRISNTETWNIKSSSRNELNEWINGFHSVGHQILPKSNIQRKFFQKENVVIHFFPYWYENSNIMKRLLLDVSVFSHQVRSIQEMNLRIFYRSLMRFVISLYSFRRSISNKHWMKILAKIMRLNFRIFK